MISVKFKKLHKLAKEPEKTFPTDAGFDLFSVEEALINPGEWHLFSTGLQILLPEGFCGEIRPRSGIAVKHGVTVLNAPGTLDAGYTGEVKVALINHGQQTYHIKTGDSLAQLVVAELPGCIMQESEIDSATQRGQLGFGSGGV